MKIAVLAAMLAAQPAPEAPSEPWAEVMLIGTYHFDNPGLDQFNVEADDVLSDTRQAELEAVVERLAEWEPDLVVVEMARERQPRADAQYAEYLEGGLREDRNEITQLGFRLAARMGHNRVAASDVQHRFFSDQHADIHENPGDRYAAVLAEQTAFGEAFMADTQALIERGASMGEILHWYNTPEQLDRNHQFYTRYSIRFWQDENQGGAHTIANWHERNLLIFQNILREVEEGDGEARRVVVFYGQGHIPLLARFIDDSPFLTLADPLEYLGD